MKKLFFMFLIYNTTLSQSYSTVILYNYNDDLPIVQVFKEKKSKTTEEKQLFNFNIGNINGDVTLFGFWEGKIGFATGFTLNPDLLYILDISGMEEGVIFEQKRVLTLDWITDSGIYFHFFINDNPDDTEFKFRYELNHFIKSINITNKPEERQINPYRTIKPGRAQDINFYFDWGNNIYRGRFDTAFDSVKPVVDKFKGNSKLSENQLMSSDYERSLYFYLPDTNISEESIEVWVNDTDGTLFNNIPHDGSHLNLHKSYSKLNEFTDYLIDYQNGFIKFKESQYKNSILINYEGVSTGGFSKSINSEYFITQDNKDYLILSSYNIFSPFEEKNSYKIGEPGLNLVDFDLTILDEVYKRSDDFSYFYDSFTGCVRIIKNTGKGDIYNIYPFYDTVGNSFYVNFYSPSTSDSKNIIQYSYYNSVSKLSLTYQPIDATLKVYVNSVLLNSSEYSYDSTTQTVSLTNKGESSDIIEIYYLANDENNFYLTVGQTNDFRINDNILIGDSYWYKMPVKLWEDSYFFKMHSSEIMYNAYLKGDYDKFKLRWDNTLSVFLPDLKNITIVEDFEYDKKGEKLTLNYKNILPVDYPYSTFADASSDFSPIATGNLIYRNMHEDNVKTNELESIYDRSGATESNTLGPYSSSDGFSYDIDNSKLTRNKKSESLILDFELDADEAISVAVPLDPDIDYTNFENFNILLDAVSFNGDIRLYIDAGSITEIFQNNSTEQTETFDEGITYNINGSTFYKGKSDGVNSSNDFDSNGILESDDINRITAFYNDTSPFLDVTPNLNKVLNFTIVDPDMLQGAKALRLTLYNPNTTQRTGKLLINQLRFTETGWSYDKTKESSAYEIFPAEDDLLVNNIFSIKNKEFDQKLHFERYSERTLKVDLKANEDFYIEKKNFYPFDSTLFNEFGFFILLKEKSDSTLKLVLKNTDGEIKTFTKKLSKLSSGKWHNITFDPGDAGLVEIIGFEFDNNDNFDNVIFIDEIYMENMNPKVGFSTAFNIEYKNRDIFAKPDLRFKTGFSTINFAEEELYSLRDNKFFNDFSFTFSPFDINHLIYSNTEFLINDNYFVNSKENFKLKISRGALNNIPLFFSIYYLFDKSKVLSSFYYQRSLSLETGLKFKHINFGISYKILNNKKTDSKVSNTLTHYMSSSYEGLETKINYTISNFGSFTSEYGDFSLDNLGYLLKEDFTKFSIHGTRKSQTLTIENSGFLTSYFSAHNKSELRYSAESKGILNTFNFANNISSSTTLAITNQPDSKTNNIVSLNYTRKLINSFDQKYKTIYWDNYFGELTNSYRHDSIIFFYPPFSSLYPAERASLAFDKLSDIASLTFTWKYYIPNHIPAPKEVGTSFEESLINITAYQKEYIITGNISGYGETTFYPVKNFTIDYLIEEKINFKENDNIYNTKLNAGFNFYLYNNLDIENSFTYVLKFTESEEKKEQEHNISTETSIYKDFYVKSYVTNDSSGIDIKYILNLSSLFYNNLNKESTKINKPITVKFKPEIGYRMNKNLRVSGLLTLAYALAYSNSLDYIKHNFGLEFAITGTITF